jgi:hypothetical protein
MSIEQKLLAAYILNIVILVPVGIGSLLGIWNPSENKSEYIGKMGNIVGCQWSTILIFSIFGLYRPQ